MVKKKEKSPSPTHHLPAKENQRLKRIGRHLILKKNWESRKSIISARRRTLYVAAATRRKKSVDPLSEKARSEIPLPR